MGFWKRLFVGNNDPRHGTTAPLVSVVQASGNEMEGEDDNHGDERIESQSYASYLSREHHIAFSHPVDWSIENENQLLSKVNICVVRLRKARPDKPSLALMVLFLPTTQKGADLSSFIESSLAQFSNAFSGFKSHTKIETQFQGYPAVWLEHSYEGRIGRIREVVLTAFLHQQHADLPLQFVFETSADTFGDDVLAFKKLLESVVLNAKKTAREPEVEAEPERAGPTPVQALSTEVLRRKLGRLSEVEVTALINAQERGDGVGIYRGLNLVFGNLTTVHFLTAAPDCRSLLEFDSDTYIQVGHGSFFSALTFGYSGRASAALSAFLEEADFDWSDSTRIEAPVKFLDDGTRVGGEDLGDKVRWEDGALSAIPRDVSIL